MRRAASALALAALVLLPSGCRDPEPFPYAITSLAVLPADVTASGQGAGRMVGEHLSRALAERTIFRVVSSDSTSRVLGAPEGIALFQRFRTMARTAGVIEAPVARAMGGRLGAQGLLYPRLALALAGPVSGTMSLTVSVYEATEGFRVWQGYSQLAFAGSPGEPAFNRSVGRVVEDIVSRMPRPAGEEN